MIQIAEKVERSKHLHFWIQIHIPQRASAGPNTTVPHRQNPRHVHVTDSVTTDSRLLEAIQLGTCQASSRDALKEREIPPGKDVLCVGGHVFGRSGGDWPVLEILQR